MVLKLNVLSMVGLLHFNSRGTFNPILLFPSGKAHPIGFRGFPPFGFMFYETEFEAGSERAGVEILVQLNVVRFIFLLD